jgi:hypothetical protein
MLRPFSIVASLLFTLASFGSLCAQTGPGVLASGGGVPRVAAIGAPEIDAAFHLLYELKFVEARRGLAAWQAAHADDPLGPAAEAASHLFEEFYAQGVLTSDFFLDDKLFLGGIKGKPDPARRDAFVSAIRLAQNLAKSRLKTNPKDANALFAMTISNGMQADYSAINSTGCAQRAPLRTMRIVSWPSSPPPQTPIWRSAPRTTSSGAYPRTSGSFSGLAASTGTRRRA